MDVAGFDAAMAEQKARARAAWAGSGEAEDEASGSTSPRRTAPTEFLGYDTETAEGQVLALVVGGKPVESAEAASRCRSSSTRPRSTPNPAARSATRARSAPTAARVADHRRRKKAGVFVHDGRVEEGTLARGAAAELAVDHDRRARDPRQPLRHPPPARGAAPRARRPRRPARLPRRPRPAALRLHPSQGDDPEELPRVEAEVNAFIRQNTPSRRA